MDVWTSAPVLTGAAAVTVVAGAAFAVGGGLERRAAAWIWAGWMMTPLLQQLTDQFDPAMLFTVVDATMLMILASLAWRSGRGWTRAAVAAQALSLLIDLVRLAAPFASYAYVSALTVAAYGVLASLAWGVWSSWRARRVEIGISS